MYYVICGVILIVLIIALVMVKKRSG